MKSPKRKWLVRTVIAISAVVVLLGLYLYRGWRTERQAGEERLAVVMKQLDEQIPGWQTYYEDRNRRLAPKEENSAFDLLKAWDQTPEDLKAWLKKNQKGEHARSQQPANQLPSKELIDELARVLDPHTGTVEEFRIFHATKPGSGFPFTSEMAERGQLAMGDLTYRSYSIARLLSRDVILQTERNRPEVALMDCRAILGISRAIGDEPNFSSILTRRGLCGTAANCVKSILGCSEPDAGLAELQMELSDECDLPYFRMMMTAELLRGNEMQLKLDQSTSPDFRSGDERNLRPHRPTSWQNFSWNYSRSRLPEQRAILIEHYLRLIDFSQQSGKHTKNKIQQSEDQFRGDVLATQSHGFVLNNLELGTADYFSQVIGFRAATLSTVAAIACERFRIANGRWPNDLAEIPKSILPAVPLDPFDDQPLRMKRTDTGLVVYSIGPDLVDHGGKLDWKMAEGWDLGFRLYDPAQRRKPTLSGRIL